MEALQEAYRKPCYHFIFLVQIGGNVAHVIGISESNDVKCSVIWPSWGIVNMMFTKDHFFSRFYVSTGGIYSMTDGFHVQISELSDKFKYKSHGFDTSQDLTKRRLIADWDSHVWCFIVLCWGWVQVD